MQDVISNIKNRLAEHKAALKINKRRLFKRAWYLVRTECLSFSDALKQVWAEIRSHHENINREVRECEMKLLNFFTPSENINRSMERAYAAGFEID